ncbi:hypothetical protein TNCV_1232241 [Trichonephila clavipes]|nr:hypothetical protein TNCV_1232241 [Trichonephila clavipes]
MPSEIINYIKKTKIKRAPGREGITNKILQNLTLPVIFQLTNIISNIFSTGHFPNSWKTASIIPILKTRQKSPQLVARVVELLALLDSRLKPVPRCVFRFPSSAACPGVVGRNFVGLRSHDMLDRSHDMLDRSHDMLDRSNDMLDTRHVDRGLMTCWTGQ